MNAKTATGVTQATMRPEARAAVLILDSWSSRASSILSTREESRFSSARVSRSRRLAAEAWAKKKVAKSGSA